MNIGNTITYQKSRERWEDIDKFRSQTSKVIGSYRGCTLEMVEKCLVPDLRKEEAKKGRSCEYSSEFDSENLFTITCDTNLSADLDL